ncbi:hypothetical protein [Aster yellows witches'-broom phytoplasma]|nr:hypothetical protein [Aster yellows witches'-broom phytoplasma]
MNGFKAKINKEKVKVITIQKPTNLHFNPVKQCINFYTKKFNTKENINKN